MGWTLYTALNLTFFFVITMIQIQRTESSLMRINSPSNPSVIYFEVVNCFWQFSEISSAASLYISHSPWKFYCIPKFVIISIKSYYYIFCRRSQQSHVIFPMFLMFDVIAYRSRSSLLFFKLLVGFTIFWTRQRRLSWKIWERDFFLWEVWKEREF